MERRRIIFGTGLALVISAALLPLLSTARAGDSICCNDVRFPGSYNYGGGGGGEIVVVDGIGRGPGVYRTIQDALDDVRKGGTVLVKPAQYDSGRRYHDEDRYRDEDRHGDDDRDSDHHHDGDHHHDSDQASDRAPFGVYNLDRPLRIRRPVTISNFGGMGVVRIRAQGGCAVVDLRRDGKVAINGLSFESEGTGGGGCIVVEHAGEFALNASDITVTGDAPPEGDRCVPSVPGKRRPLGMPQCGYSGVVILSGIATLQGNRIRRTGTAIALLNTSGDPHKVIGNYIAGNAVGVYADGGARFLIEGNGIFRNHNIGIDLADSSGTVTDNDIEDNWTGLKIVPPSAFSATAYAGDGRAAVDYTDMSRALIRVERNLITQYGVYRPNSYDIYHDNGRDKLKDPTAEEPRDGYKRDREEKARYGYALDFALDVGYLNDNVYDYPKRGSILSGIAVNGNCFFGPSTSWFDRDRFTRVIAPNPSKGDGAHGDEGDKAPYWYLAGDEAAYRNNSHSSGYKDALTPLWFFDANTWVEHLDYDAVDKIDHDNTIDSPLTETFHGGLLKAIHNWFARNKREMTCGGRAVVSAPGDWPRFDTNPTR
jgi:parallel beta-helix repeat protein